MPQQTSLLKIGDFARQAGTNLRTLRYYEELGLIEPIERSTGGFRYYAPEQLARIEAIKRLQGLGLSLREIQEMMRCDGTEEHTVLTSRLDDALSRQATILKARIAEMQGDLELIAQSQQRLAKCQTCEVDLCARDCDPCPKDGADLPSPLKALL